MVELIYPSLVSFLSYILIVLSNLIESSFAMYSYYLRKNYEEAKRLQSQLDRVSVIKSFQFQTLIIFLTF